MTIHLKILLIDLSLPNAESLRRMLSLENPDPRASEAQWLDLFRKTFGESSKVRILRRRLLR